MLVDSELNRAALRILEQQWTQACQDDRNDVTAHERPPTETLLEFVELIAQHPEREVDRFESVIRNRLVELHFVADNGDSVVLDDVYEDVDQKVRFWLRVLRNVRQYALRTGQWSATPVTPQMFG